VLLAIFPTFYYQRARRDGLATAAVTSVAVPRVAPVAVVVAPAFVVIPTATTVACWSATNFCGRKGAGSKASHNMQSKPRYRRLRQRRGNPLKGGAAACLYICNRGHPLSASTATLPRSTKPMSRIIFGADSIGALFPWSSTSDTFRFLDAIVDLGCTAIDTAAIYRLGASERLIGDWISQRNLRNRIFLITKGAHPFFNSRFNLRAITADLHGSLRRLHTDHVDLYLLHRDDSSKPCEDVLALLARFHREGKCRAYGVSNWSVPRIEAAVRFLDAEGLPPLTASSPHYSLVDWVRPYMPGCLSIAGQSGNEARVFHEQTQLPVLAWSPLGRGLFSSPTPEFKRPPWYNLNRRLAYNTYASEHNFARRRRAQQLAQDRGVTAAQIALAFVMNQPFPVFPIVGTHSVGNMQKNLQACELRLTQNECRYLVAGEGGEGFNGSHHQANRGI
jgi:aryl-alcohol dehydrogenase-like predicted oxidoreductase